jgi:hypothetical protein
MTGFGYSGIPLGFGADISRVQDPQGEFLTSVSILSLGFVGVIAMAFVNKRRRLEKETAGRKE